MPTHTCDTEGTIVLTERHAFFQGWLEKNIHILSHTHTHTSHYVLSHCTPIVLNHITTLCPLSCWPTPYSRAGNTEYYPALYTLHKQWTRWVIYIHTKQLHISEPNTALEITRVVSQRELIKNMSLQQIQDIPNAVQDNATVQRTETCMITQQETQP